MDDLLALRQSVWPLLAGACGAVDLSVPATVVADGVELAPEGLRFAPGLSDPQAMIKNLQRGGIKQGGSTITQQIIKRLLLSSEKSYKRKIREAILAYRLEKYLTKDEILTIYLNQIYLGSRAYGVEAAARTYFGVHAAKQIVRDQIQAVGQGHNGIQGHGIACGGDAASASQQQGFDQDFQQRHRQSRIEQGIGKRVQVDEVLPGKQRTVPDAPAAEHGLDDVAQARDAEPDERSEPDQEPPGVDRGERGRGYGETDEDFEGVFDRGAEVAPAQA